MGWDRLPPGARVQGGSASVAEVLAPGRGHANRGKEFESDLINTCHTCV